MIPHVATHDGVVVGTFNLSGGNRLAQHAGITANTKPMKRAREMSGIRTEKSNHWESEWFSISGASVDRPGSGRRVTTPLAFGLTGLAAPWRPSLAGPVSVPKGDFSGSPGEDLHPGSQSEPWSEETARGRRGIRRVLLGSIGSVRAKVIERAGGPKFASSEPREHASPSRASRRPQQEIGEICGPASPGPPAAAALIILRPPRRSPTPAREL